MSLEDEFTLAAGAEEDFETIFFSPRIEADLSLDFDIIASITSVMVLPVDQLNQSATYSGEVTIETFGMVDRPPTVPPEPRGERGNQHRLHHGNDGNAEDKIEVNIANLAELEGAGFSFEGSFVAETVMVEGTSAERTIVLRTLGSPKKSVSKSCLKPRAPTMQRLTRCNPPSRWSFNPPPRTPRWSAVAGGAQPRPDSTLCRHRRRRHRSSCSSSSSGVLCVAQVDLNWKT